MVQSIIETMIAEIIKKSIFFPEYWCDYSPCAANDGYMNAGTTIWEQRRVQNNGFKK